MVSEMCIRDRVDVVFIEPAVLDEPLPFAFQFQDTYAILLSFSEPSPSSSIVKPLGSKEVNSVSVPSAPVVFDLSCLETPLTESNNLCDEPVVDALAFAHNKSG